MKPLQDTCRIAVVQAAPVMFDKDACLQKALELIDSCAARGAELIVFPELFLPGYPYGMTYGFTVGSRTAAGREDWSTYYDNSLLAAGPELRRLRDSARTHGVYISIGYSERDSLLATLYNSNLMIAPDGAALNHRKLKPTGSERVVWGDGDRDFFPVMDTPWGPMGNLICWESYMPLERTALYQKGVAIYISPNTNDNPEWQHTIRHIAIEGHCYFVNCNMFFTRADYPKTASGGAEIAALPEIVCRGGSCVIDPYGHEASETLWDREGVVYAELTMRHVPASRMEHDVCGHYARPDVLSLRVKEDDPPRLTKPKNCVKLIKNLY
ncbi:MAG: carbon-nitrogen hydrolase family protein [Oscillospiraceae bacterium]|nr:carbon-nitrogen hydrolase family protein [Oscillospiraceae bacterium]